MRRVLLVNPNQMKPAVAPLALDYLAHALRESGFKVDLLDLCFACDPEREIAAYFTRNEVSAISMTLRNTDDTYFASQDFCIPRVKAVIDSLKARTSAPLILGGAGFSVMPEAILDYCGVELGVWGEGEYSLPLLVSRIVSGEDFTDVPGLLYRTNKGFRRNQPKYLDLGKLKAPDRGTVDNRRYFREGGMGGIEAKRGCPRACIYCADPLGKGRKLRLRSPQSVVDEIEKLLEIGVDYLHFCDSEFNIPESHAREVCLEIIRRELGGKVRWYTYASPTPFTEELAGLMKRAGCVGINFGVDSGVDEMLRTLGRDFTVEDLEHTADICHRHDIVFMYDLLLGGPGETKGSLRRTVETMKRLSPSRVGTALGIRVFPGTRLASGVIRREGPLEKNSSLQGTIRGNNGFFAPIFYLSAALGDGAASYLAELIGGDERFFFGVKEVGDRNYNYNDNSVLVNAIQQGYRGAFWDILRRLGEGG